MEHAVLPAHPLACALGELPGHHVLQDRAPVGRFTWLLRLHLSRLLKPDHDGAPPSIQASDGGSVTATYTFAPCLEPLRPGHVYCWCRNVNCHLLPFPLVFRSPVW